MIWEKGLGCNDLIKGHNLSWAVGAGRFEPKVVEFEFKGFVFLSCMY
jgi:hypothetical protein